MWPDITAEALAHLHAHQPQLKVISALDHPLLRPARHHRPPPAADPLVPLDQPHANAIAHFDWDAAAARARASGVAEFSGAAVTEGASASNGAAGAGGRRELTLAERFRWGGQMCSRLHICNTRLKHGTVCAGSDAWLVAGRRLKTSRGRALATSFPLLEAWDSPVC